LEQSNHEEIEFKRRKRIGYKRAEEDEPIGTGF
jgi:hypothetical protein